MRGAILGVVALLLLAGSVQALDDNQYYTISLNQTRGCIYILLPQDMGISSVNRSTVAILEVESPWIRLSYNKVTLDPGVSVKVPVCFYPTSIRDGEYAHYNIRVYSQFNEYSKYVSGGMCVSNYSDVDSGVEVMEGEDICELMSDNSDVFDIQFKEEKSVVSPGESVYKTIYVTSYADVDVQVSLQTDLENDFSGTTLGLDETHPVAANRFMITAPDTEGNYTLKMTGRIAGCSESFCFKETESLIEVREGASRESYTATVVPKNINIKSENTADYRIIITNYGPEQDFTVSATSYPDLDIDPETESVSVYTDEEETIRFGVTPPSGDKELYRLEFEVSTDDSNVILESYLTVGELFTDAMRDLEQKKEEVGDDSFDEDADEIFSNWKNSYENSDYGEDIEDYEQFKEDLDESKESHESGGNGGKENGNGNGEIPPPGGFDWTLVIIPIIIVVAIILFIVYKKSRVVDKYEYPDFQ